MDGGAPVHHGTKKPNLLGVKNTFDLSEMMSALTNTRPAKKLRPATSPMETDAQRRQPERSARAAAVAATANKRTSNKGVTKQKLKRLLALAEKITEKPEDRKEKALKAVDNKVKFFNSELERQTEQLQSLQRKLIDVEQKIAENEMNVINYNALKGFVEAEFDKGNEKITADQIYAHGIRLMDKSLSKATTETGARGGRARGV